MQCQHELAVFRADVVAGTTSARYVDVEKPFGEGVLGIPLAFRIP
jgi:hypothetical protein